MTDPNQITAADVARRLGVAKSTVAAWMRAGRLPGTLMAGRTWVTTWAEVAAAERLPQPTPQRRKRSLDAPEAE